MLLYRTIIPKEENETTGLYYRAGSGVSLRNGILELQPDAVVSFNTYFNGFFYEKYLKYTIVRDLTVKIEASGQLHAELICIGRDLTETVVESMEISASAAIFGPVSLALLPDGGMLFCRFRSVNKSSILSIQYETKAASERQVSLEAVICTYHREKYVRRNIKRLSESVWNNFSPISNELDVVVVDNGNSLGMYEDRHIRIVPNRNLGGSGGFARGMIEALDCGEKYTHVLLMDDDISFEPEVLLRTVQLLKVLKELDRPVCIGGQMLIEDSPTVQYESGGRFVKGRVRANGQGLNLSDLAALLENEGEKPIDYNAWWYCCIPTKVIRDAGLPLPFFIKEDDVEYGLRTRARFLVTNGIGVWHQNFSKKQSPHLEYYIKRNELIVSAVYGIGGGITRSLVKLLRSLGGSVLRRETERIAYIKRGYDDFLKGPELLLKMDAERLNGELIRPKEAKPPSTASSLFLCAGIVIEILPRFLFRYKIVREEYLKKHGELTSELSWRKRLGLHTME